MALKKSELYSTLWKSCDELRGGMDASQYKDYVLVLLFVKYVTDKYAGNRDALLVELAGGSFSDMVALKNTKEIGEQINVLVACLADANPDLLGSIKNAADFDSDEKLGKHRLGRVNYYLNEDLYRCLLGVGTGAPDPAQAQP